MATTRKDILKTLNSRKKLKKDNVTYRLSVDVVEDFRSACKLDGFKPGVIIEEFMKGYIRDKKEQKGG